MDMSRWWRMFDW